MYQWNATTLTWDQVSSDVGLTISVSGSGSGGKKGTPATLLVGRPHTALKHPVPLKHPVQDHLNVLSEREPRQFLYS